MGKPIEIRNVTKKPQWVPWCRQSERSLQYLSLPLPNNPSGFPGAKSSCRLEECEGSKPENRVTHQQGHHRTKLKHDYTSGQLLRGAYSEELGRLFTSILAARTHLCIIYVNVLCIKRLDDILPLL